VDKLTTSDKLILIGGGIYFIAMFLPWWGIDTGFGDYANSGWDYFLGGWLPLVLIAIMAVHVALTRFSPDTKIPDLPVPWGQGYLIAGVVAAVIVVLRLLVPAEECAGGFCVDLDRKFGILIAVIAAICVAVGGSMKLKEDEPGAAMGGGDTGSAPF
jgi:hypothetical protein